MATTPRRFRWGFLVVGAVLVGMIVWLVYGNKKAARTNPSPTVAVTTTKAADSPLSPNGTLVTRGDRAALRIAHRSPSVARLISRIRA